MEKTISENILRGIVVVLHEHAPHLLPLISHLVRASETQAPSGGMGASIYGTLTGSIPHDEGESVLQALLQAEQVHGPAARFADVQLSFLIEQWQDFAALRRLPP